MTPFQSSAFFVSTPANQANIDTDLLSFTESIYPQENHPLFILELDLQARHLYKLIGHLLKVTHINIINDW